MAQSALIPASMKTRIGWKKKLATFFTLSF
jgi:hypothetical protein